MASFKKLENGKWQVSFYCKDHLGNNKKIKKAGFKTKAEANSYANDYISKFKGGNDIKLSVLLEEYYNFKVKNKIKFSTLRGYKTYNKKLLEYFDDITISKITNKSYSEFLLSLNNAPSIKQLINIYVKSVIKFGTIYYNLKEITFTNIDIDFKYDKKKKEVLSLGEFNEFINSIDNPTTKLYFSTLYWCGLRAGECSALTYNDIDLENRIINVNKTRIGNGEITSPKTKTSNRTVSMPQTLVNMYEEYLKRIPLKKGNIFKSMSTYNKILREYNMSNHIFRHSHVSLLISKNVDIATISKRIGHSNSQMTLSVYAHMLKDKDNALDVLDNL